MTMMEEIILDVFLIFPGSHMQILSVLIYICSSYFLSPPQSMDLLQKSFSMAVPIAQKAKESNPTVISCPE